MLFVQHASDMIGVYIEDSASYQKNAHMKGDTTVWMEIDELTVDYFLEKMANDLWFS